MIYGKKPHHSFLSLPFWGMGAMDDYIKHYKLLIFLNSEMENVTEVCFHSLSCSEAFGVRCFGTLS